MQTTILKFLSSLFAAMILATTGSAIAAKTSAGDTVVQQEPAPDCKKNPDDPKCSKK